eukprot:TRINITY_DN14117_c0_g1_i1.p1 TRINITY_DN14117_c0_g1~~TRINITY_DN14117_c0_g1_i1.p1  ORF type:complete len:202 (-),score=96.09 TRINITY_DN14117_c0_g1_i1:47-652(-)
MCIRYRDTESSVEAEVEASNSIKKESMDLKSMQDDQDKRHKMLKDLNAKKTELVSKLAVSKLTAEKDLLKQELEDVNSKLHDVQGKADKKAQALAKKKGDIDKKIEGQQKGQTKMDEKILKLQLEAGKSLTMSDFRKANAGITKIQDKVEVAKNNLKTAENGGLEKPKKEDNANRLVEEALKAAAQAVSYTHLTLPTIYSV